MFTVLVLKPHYNPNTASRHFHPIIGRSRKSEMHTRYIGMFCSKGLCAEPEDLTYNVQGWVWITIWFLRGKTGPYKPPVVCQSTGFIFGGICLILKRKGRKIERDNPKRVTRFSKSFTSITPRQEAPDQGVMLLMRFLSL